jgi:general secretion pathway protein H
MQTSETGRCPSRANAALPSSIRGFTLIEILVVVVIIGILATGAVLSLGVIGQDRQLERERDRIVAVTDYLREQAALQNREFGMRVFDGGYDFLSWDARTSLWERVQDDPLLRPRTLPPGLETRLLVEGRPVILPQREVEHPAPQIMLFSSGDLSSFELTLKRTGAGAAGGNADPAEIFTPDMQSGEIRVRSVAPGAS